MKEIKKIVISRTDRIGDVILTLPLAGVLKKHFPHSHIIFLGNSYTLPILKLCSHIDTIIDYYYIKSLHTKEQVEFVKNLNADVVLHIFPLKHIAKLFYLAKTKYRVGTSHRLYNWIYCNKLLNIGRKNSNLHEAELNLLFLKAFKIPQIYPLEILPQFYGIKNLSNNTNIVKKIKPFIEPNKYNIILHPKTGGSTKEWPIEYYIQLCNLLPSEHYNIIFTGTEEEGKFVRPFFSNLNIPYHDTTGKLSLEELIYLINSVDCLISASTGPLHISAALGKNAIGIYPSIRPLHPQRWKPIGKNAYYLFVDKNCSKCKKSDFCECMYSITPQMVAQKIKKILLRNL